MLTVLIQYVWMELEHVCRMNNELLPKILIDWSPIGRQGRGRQGWWVGRIRLNRYWNIVNESMILTWSGKEKKIILKSLFGLWKPLLSGNSQGRRREQLILLTVLQIIYDSLKQN